MPPVLVAASAEFWRDIDRLGRDAVLAASESPEGDNRLLEDYVTAGVNLEAFRLRGWHAWQRLRALRQEIGDLTAHLRQVAVTLEGPRAANLARLAVEEELTGKGSEVEERRISFFEFPVVERELDLAGQLGAEGEDEPGLLRLAAGYYRLLGSGLDREGLDRGYRRLAGQLAGIKFSVYEMQGEERRMRLRRNALRQAAGLFQPG